MKHSNCSGWHLILDAVVSETRPIADPEHLRGLLLRLVRLLGMDILDGPRITEVELDPSRLERGSDEGGITGYCLISTSHISIHTWPLRRRFSLDVFSCKEFDRELLTETVRESLGVISQSVTWIERHWPDAPEWSTAAATAATAAGASAGSREREPAGS
ncbi:MAG: S-adenosylmethionine decarboxylase [Planctomycetota bacterium]